MQLYCILVIQYLLYMEYRYVLYAFIGHFILNFPLAFIQDLASGIYIAIAYIAVMALISLYWVVKVSPDMFRRLYIEDIETYTA